jgi:hypothetical protein
MPVTVSVVLSILALLLTVASAINWCPLWVPVTLLCVLALIQAFGVK